jgi:hypothetical protein
MRDVSEMMRCWDKESILAAPTQKRRISMRAMCRPDVLNDSDSSKEIGLAVRHPGRHAAILMQDMVYVGGAPVKYSYLARQWHSKLDPCKG